MRVNRLAGFFFLLFYSFIWELLYLILQVITFFVPHFRERLGQRGLKYQQNATINSASRPHSLFFCSSAGEYEQAKPLALELDHRFPAHHSTFIFFSISGFRFAKVRKELSSFLLSPPDAIWRWFFLLKKLRPDRIFVIRHELWPGFMWTANFFAPLYLVNATLPASSASKRLPVVKAFLLGFLTRIFAVDEEAVNHFTDVLKQPRAKIFLSGDTKYDQVWNRLQAQRTLESKSFLKYDASFTTIIIGSAWEDDVRCVVSALCSIANKQQYRLIVVPHDIGAERVERMLDICREWSSLVFRWSDFSGGEFQTLMVDRMGLLTELYGLADIAFVGGALHHRIHNVLEPACYGLAIAHGPSYQTSPEAKKLVTQHLSRVVGTAADFKKFLQDFHQQEVPRGKIVVDFVAELRGAAQRIVAEIL